MCSKGQIFTRHGTTDIGLNIVNATNKYASGRVFAANDNSSNNNFKVNAPAINAVA